MTDDDRSKKGTGEEIARIDLGGLGELVIKDDDYDDCDISRHIIDHNGDRIPRSVSSHITSMRMEHGDAWVMDRLNEDSASSVGASSFDRAPPTYSCDTCHNTWPRGTNQTPDADEDTCPECAGE